MKRMEFMQALERAMLGIPEEERREALQYYEDYLADAGEENEEEALAALGTPEEIAASIRAGLTAQDGGGEFTEQGFSAGKEKLRVPARQMDKEYREGPAFGRMDFEETAEKKKINGWKIFAIALLCLLLAPVCVPIAIGAVAVVLSVLIGAMAIVVGLIAAGAAVFIAGLLISAGAVTLLFVHPAGALVTAGCGLLASALGLFLLLAFGWFLMKAVILLIQGLVWLCRLPFHKKMKGGNVK